MQRVVVAEALCSPPWCYVHLKRRRETPSPNSLRSMGWQALVLHLPAQAPSVPASVYLLDDQVMKTQLETSTG